MLNLMAGSLGGHIPSVRVDRLAVLSVVTNASCNLSCRHCYLRPEGPAVGMQQEEWLQLLGSVFADLQPHSICFSGKEVFARKDSANILFEAIPLRNRIQVGMEHRTRIGVITNGTLAGQYRDQLAECLPDWLDISIDGTRELHDAIRGKGAFDRMARNLPWLVELLGDRLWITPTLMETNIDALPEIVDSLYQMFGLRRFAVGLYKPQSYTDSLLRLQDVGRESRILRALNGLGEIGPVDGIEVRLEFDSSDHGLRTRLEDDGLIPKEGVVRVAERRLDNGVVLRFSTTAVRVGLWRAVRVTNEGLWVAAEDLVDATGYQRRATCHVADFDYDAQQAYKAGLAHPRFKELFGTTAEGFLSTLARTA
jgi:pyruvate-formate lyase-activating enzyme